MKQDTDKKMRALLDNASLQEVMPAFDPEAVWQRIAANTAAPEKKRISWRWLGYAASLAAGLLLAGLFFLREQPRTGAALRGQAIGGISVPTAPPPVPDAPAPPVFTVQQSHTPLRVKRQQGQRSAVPTISQPLQPSPVSPEPLAATAAGPASPQPAAAPVRAVHLLDMGDDEKEMVLQPAPVALEIPSLGEQLRKHPGRMHSSTRSSNSELAARALFRDLITHNKTEE